MEFLKKLCEVPGVTGFESRAQSLVMSELATCCDEVWTDPRIS